MDPDVDPEQDYGITDYAGSGEGSAPADAPDVPAPVAAPAPSVAPEEGMSLSPRLLATWVTEFPERC